MIMDDKWGYPHLWKHPNDKAWEKSALTQVFFLRIHWNRIDLVPGLATPRGPLMMQRSLKESKALNGPAPVRFPHLPGFSSRHFP